MVMMKRRDAKGDFSLRNLEHFSDRFTMICNDLNKLSIRLDLISDSLITKAVPLESLKPLRNASDLSNANLARFFLRQTLKIESDQS